MTESCYGATFVADLERRLACAHADKKLLAELLAAKTGKLDDLVNEFDVCRADLKATRRLNDGHCAAIDDYIEQLNQSAEARSALMVRISGLQDELALLKQQPDAPLRHENDALRADLAYLRRVNADLRTQINESTKVHNTSTAYINSLKDDVAGLRRQLVNTQNDLKAARIDLMAEPKCPPPELKIVDAVVLAGWNGMEMTRDHQGNTVLRRTS